MAAVGPFEDPGWVNPGQDVVAAALQGPYELGLSVGSRCARLRNPVLYVEDELSVLLQWWPQDTLPAPSQRGLCHFG